MRSLRATWPSSFARSTSATSPRCRPVREGGARAHDFTRHQLDQALAEKSGAQQDRRLMPWADLAATAQVYESGPTTVVFDKSPSDYEPPRYDSWGRQAARYRGRRRNVLR
ncbi:MAG TPA: hypothetical protein VGH53_16840 [Streptosporangiaceae bacterium]